MLRLFLFLLATGLGLSKGHAADLPHRQIIGFSKDARWFAFRSVGVHDGSGYPFAELYILDVTNNLWAPETPARVTIENEQMNVNDAINLLNKKTGRLLSIYEPFYPARVLASLPLSQFGREERQVQFKPNPYGPEIKLELKQTSIGPLDKCYGLGEANKFLLVGGQLGREATVVYADTSYPKSRGCALGYSIADVIALPQDRPPDKFVILIHIFTPGFEGQDVGFLAVPIEVEYH